MNNNDLMIRLVADVKAWEDGMSRAGKSVGDLNKKVENNNSILSSAIGALGKYVTATAALTTAMKVVKDAFNRSEIAMDAWGEAMEVGKSTYNTFLDTINGGDWTNFFSNIKTAISDARELYAALDEMGSVRALNQYAIFQQRTRIQQLKLEKQTATDPAQIQKIDDELKQVSARLKELLEEDVTATQNAAIKQGTSTLASIYNAQRGAGKLSETEAKAILEKIATGGKSVVSEYARIMQELQAKGQDAVLMTVGGGAAGVGTTVAGQGFNINKLSAAEQHMYKLAKAVVDGEGVLGQSISLFTEAGKAAESMNRELVAANRVIMQKGRSVVEPGVSALKLGSAPSGLGFPGLSGEMLISRMQPTEEAMEHFRKWFEENPPTPIEIPIATSLKDMKTIASGIADSFNAAAGALGNFANESRQAAIAAKAFTIAGAIAQLVGQFASIPKGKEIWSWIAGTIAGTGTLVATIASIKNATNSYSEGGRIRGAHSTGDMIPVFANAGEVILNAGMQRNIASQLVGSGSQTLDFELRGDILVGCINNWSRGRGMGKLSFGG